MHTAQAVEAQIYEGFSGPYRDFDEVFFETLVSHYATSVIGMLWERFGASLGSGSTQFLARAASQEGVDFDVLWSPSVAIMQSALRSGYPLDAQRGLAQFLLQASAKGLRGDWSLSIDHPSVLWWDSYLLPEIRSLEVRSSGDQVRIRMRNGRARPIELRFDWVEESGQWSTGASLKRMAVARDASLRVKLVSRQAFPQLDCGAPLVPETKQEHCRPVVQALQLLREQHPRYHGWVARVLRNLVLVESEKLESANFGGYLGMFYMTHWTDPILVAETFIHECCHQYFYALGKLERFTDRTDTATYYSPFPDEEVSLSKILLAYHAFANVWLFYRECIDSGFCTVKDRPAMARMIANLQTVERVLLESDKLTAAGWALTEPLYQEMRSRPPIALE